MNTTHEHLAALIQEIITNPVVDDGEAESIVVITIPQIRDNLNHNRPAPACFRISELMWLASIREQGAFDQAMLELTTRKLLVVTQDDGETICLDVGAAIKEPNAAQRRDNIMRDSILGLDLDF